jgi:heme-degrading monooxygenase HmoA
MIGKTMFLIRVKPGMEAEFVERWSKEVNVLKAHRGFRSRELIRVVEAQGTFVVLSEWDSPEDYIAWRDSKDRAQVYENDLSPLFSAPPITGVGEVVMRME